MIIAGQMQHAMHREVDGVICEKFGCRPGFGLRHAIGDGDVAAEAAMTRKGQHIRWLVLAAKIAIQRRQPLVIRQKNCDLALQLHGPGGSFRRLFQPDLNAALPAPVGVFNHQRDPAHDLSPRL